MYADYHFFIRLFRRQGLLLLMLKRIVDSIFFCWGWSWSVPPWKSAWISIYICQLFKNFSSLANLCLRFILGKLKAGLLHIRIWEGRRWLLARLRGLCCKVVFFVTGWGSSTFLFDAFDTFAFWWFVGSLWCSRLLWVGMAETIVPACVLLATNQSLFSAIAVTTKVFDVF